MKSPKPPAAPDPAATAAAQTGTNVSTALANAHLQNVNQITPDGSLTYSTNGSQQFTDPTSGASYSVPTYTATTTLSPQQQAIKNQSDAAELNLAKTANQQSEFLQGYLGRQVDTSGIPGVQYGAGTQNRIQGQLGEAGGIQSSFGDAGAITKTYGTDFSEDRQRTEDAMYARLNPQIDQARAAEETRLQNQGIRIGSTAWENAMSDFNRGVNDQRTSITLAGGQEQSRLVGLERDRATFENAAQQQNFGQLAGRAQFSNAAQEQNFSQLLARGQFANSAQAQEFGQNASNVAMNNQGRSQAISELFAQRNQPINEISALLGGAQVQNPQFQSTSMPQIPTVDYAGLVNQNYQNRLGVYNQQQANRQSTMGGLFGLGSAAIMASDRRLKTDVVRLGTGALGLPVYAFRYVWGGPVHVGHMAQDVLRILPAAVVRMANGFLGVDYARLFREEIA